MKNVKTTHAYSTITCEEDKLKLGNQFLSAFREHDWELLRTIITEDCTWSLPGSGNLAGELAGADKVIDYARKFAGKLRLDINHLHCSLNCVAVAIYNQVFNPNSDGDEHIATVNVMRDGKISAINTFFSDMTPMRDYFAQLSHRSRFNITD